MMTFRKLKERFLEHHNSKIQIRFPIFFNFIRIEALWNLLNITIPTLSALQNNTKFRLSSLVYDLLYVLLQCSSDTRVDWWQAQQSYFEVKKIETRSVIL